MTRKEYLKKKKKSKRRYLAILKPLVILTVIVALSIYVFNQLKIYNKMTELANKVVEESKLIKTYKMYFMAKPYTSEQDNILYYYMGADESRHEIPAGEGLKNISKYDNFIYGIKENSLYRINLTSEEIELVVEGNVQDFIINKDGLFVYKYIKGDKTNTGLYSVVNKEETLIISATLHKITSDENNLYVIAEAGTTRTALKYSYDGELLATLTNKIIVNDLIVSEDYIYYSNKSDKNKIYRIKKDGSDNVVVTDNSTLESRDVFDVYNKHVIYINASDKNVYITSEEGEDKILVENNVKMLQLVDNMLYFSLNDKIGIYRYNLESNELEKITSARIIEMICLNK